VNFENSGEAELALVRMWTLTNTLRYVLQHAEMLQETVDVSKTVNRKKSADVARKQRWFAG